MQFTFLGTGTSHGIPLIGCSCPVCTSENPKNRRRRSSLYVVAAGKHLVFDTPPDFREQVLSFGVQRVDALFITHPHADHIYGFDDIRRFSTLQQQHIPVYGSAETLRLMHKKFDYVHKTGYSFESVPRVQFVEQTTPVAVGDAVVTPLPVEHGPDSIYGFKIEADGRSLAYIPDCSSIPDSTMERLHGLDAMILDGLRPKAHPTHFNITQCVEHLARIGAKRSFLIHLTHDSEHETLQSKLGSAVTVPWDGLKLEL
ncbi:MAG: MBL fold metallo-hydrolase [Pontiellaceae bacterium]|nr:MBL fold metallo-hydrolase [Pontiellaceae bacterium]